MVNEVARHVRDGGQRRAALIAILAWWHQDIEEFITAKNWSSHIKALKEDDFNFPAPLDMTNISMRLDDNFFKEIKKNDAVRDLYYRVVKNMAKTGEPGLSIDVGKNKNAILRNPCGEITSDTPYDTCNLGSINLSRIDSLSELEDVTRLAVRFLYKGTYMGTLPHPDFLAVREKNRRIGLGIMGLHELCIKNGQAYEPSGLLGKWLHTWEEVSDEEAKKVAAEHNDVVPVAVRAVAPNGTTSIIGETTSGIEPIFCVAYKRRWLDGSKWKFQYVVDPTAARLIKEGVNPDDIEDCYKLSRDVERRLAMQAFVQEHVDQGISSTINVPEWGEPGNNNAKKFSEILLKYLPKLRGVTVFPEGCRPGQPLTPIKYETAMKHNNVVYEEDGERCKGGVCSI
jgi:ribonucleoside-diphosphate reductase alpha chain